jgi:hypothetical protein
MDKNTIVETAKFLLRLAVLYAPLGLAFIADYDAKGVFLAISTLLAGLDKGVHVSEKTELKGLVPF